MKILVGKLNDSAPDVVLNLFDCVDFVRDKPCLEHVELKNAVV